MIGFNWNDRKKVYIADFGFAMPWKDEDTGAHNDFQTGMPSVGTLRYETINSHKNYLLSRRDDLESMGHVFIYFLKGGKLPWMGLKDVANQAAAILKIKEETTIEQLTEGLPKQFCEYQNYCRNLKYDEDPDYDYLKKLFEDCKKENGIFGLTKLVWDI